MPLFHIAASSPVFAGGSAGRTVGLARIGSDFAWRCAPGLMSAALAALLLSGGPAAAAEAQPLVPETLAAPAVAYQVPSDPDELLKVDEPMRRFFAARMQPHRGRADQLCALVEAILRPDGLNFTYDREFTSDARETFRQRRGNCVSYSFLVVAVAREFGFDVSFQEVATPLRWDRIGNLVVSVRHMNVRVDLGPVYYIIDLQTDLLAGIVRSDMRVVADARAQAGFYDAAGFFALLHGRPEAALHCMRLATQIDPSSAEAWANLASLQVHRGNPGEARGCFERSLRADPGDLIALEGYVRLLHQLGSVEDLRIAARHERRAQSVRDHNPYYQQRLAENARERGDWTAAEKLFRRAISLKRDEVRFHEQWVETLRQLGREDDARRAMARLEKLRRRLAADQLRHLPGRPQPVPEASYGSPTSSAPRAP